MATLMKPFFGEGHIVYVDNWYTSPELFKFLYNNNTGVNRKNMPVFAKKSKKREVEFQYTQVLGSQVARQEGRPHAE